VPHRLRTDETSRPGHQCDAHLAASDGLPRGANPQFCGAGPDWSIVGPAVDDRPGAGPMRPLCDPVGRPTRSERRPRTAGRPPNPVRAPAPHGPVNPSEAFWAPVRRGHPPQAPAPAHPCVVHDQDRPAALYNGPHITKVSPSERRPGANVWRCCGDQQILVWSPTRPEAETRQVTPPFRSVVVLLSCPGGSACRVRSGRGSLVHVKGVWRNGRRARFRSVCPEGRGSSTLPTPTTRRSGRLFSGGGPFFYAVRSPRRPRVARQFGRITLRPGRGREA